MIKQGEVRIGVTHKDGSILEIMLEVTAIKKMGHDINNGMPCVQLSIPKYRKNKIYSERIVQES